jgi:hypothetical protein
MMLEGVVSLCKNPVGDEYTITRLLMLQDVVQGQES